MKLYFRDFPCYQNLTLEVMLRPTYEPDSSFDLSRMPNEPLRQAFAAFIFDRASSLSYSSLRSEATHFHNFARFISDAYPDLQSITDIPFNDMEKELKKYLIKQGNRTYFQHYMKYLLVLSPKYSLQSLHEKYYGAKEFIRFIESRHRRQSLCLWFHPV